MSTTYVFGAGASRDVGYPLASDMGDGLLDFMLKSPDASIHASGQFLIDTFGRSPNIEDLITALESRVAQLKDAPSADERAQRTRLGNSRAFLGTALQLWFREIHMRPAPSYAAFAASIAQPGDVILTFNYDDFCRTRTQTHREVGYLSWIRVSAWKRSSSPPMSSS